MEGRVSTININHCIFCHKDITDIFPDSGVKLRPRAGTCTSSTIQLSAQLHVSISEFLLGSATGCCRAVAVSSCLIDTEIFVSFSAVTENCFVQSRQQ